MFVQMMSSKLPNICYQTWYYDAWSWAGVSCKMIGLLFSRSRSQPGLILSIMIVSTFRTTDPFAIKLGLKVNHYIPECLIKKLDHCVLGHGHSKILKCQWMFVQRISSESLNLLLPNLLWWCIIIILVVFQNVVCVFKVKVTVKDHIIKVWLSNISSGLLILLQLNMVWWHIIIRWIVLWKDWISLLW